MNAALQAARSKRFGAKLNMRGCFLLSPLPIFYEFIKQEKDIEFRRILVRGKTKLRAYYERMAIIKSDVWQSENEWRLMWKSRTEGITVYKCPISQDCVTNIFIGLKHCAPVAELVAEAKRTFPNAGIFRAKKRHGDLALDFEEL